jgi:uncharacterized membrane protein YphA (DoxX/SURF4 family)
MILLIVRIALAAVFITAAGAKFAGQDAFAVHIRRLFPFVGRAAVPLAFALPTAEVAIGSELVVGAWSPAPALAGALLMCAFSVALLRASQIRSGCHCFGGLSRSRPVDWRHLTRNAVLLCGCLVIAAADRTSASPAAGWLGLAVAASLTVAVLVATGAIKGKTRRRYLIEAPTPLLSR